MIGRTFARSACLAVVTSLGLAGCVTNEVTPLPTPGTAAAVDRQGLDAMPVAMVGDSVKYSRGSRLKVTEIAGDLVHWQRGRSTAIVKPRNPFLPNVRFENSKVIIAAELDAPADALFPLAVGNQVEFVEKRHVTYKRDGRQRSYDRQWNCEVIGQEQIEVKSGRFDSFVVRCENPASDALWRTARAYEWHYAPALGQIVKERYERFRKSTRQKELVRFATTAPIARGSVYQAALQDAFETQPSATPLDWGGADGGQSGTIEIRRTFRLADGTFCRDADIQVATAGKPIGQNLRACRNEAGKWVPRLP